MGTERHDLTIERLDVRVTTDGGAVNITCEMGANPPVDPPTLHEWGEALTDHLLSLEQGAGFTDTTVATDAERQTVTADMTVRHHTGALDAAVRIITALRSAVDGANWLGRHYPRVRQMLPPGERDRFEAEWRELSRTGTFGQRRQMLAEWEATANSHADPELFRALTRDVD